MALILGRSWATNSMGEKSGLVGCSAFVNHQQFFFLRSWPWPDSLVIAVKPDPGSRLLGCQLKIQYQT